MTVYLARIFVWGPRTNLPLGSQLYGGGVGEGQDRPGMRQLEALAQSGTIFFIEHFMREMSLSSLRA